MNKTKASHLIRGSNTEQLALKQLHQHGLNLVTSNYQCRCGEIDLIMLDNNSLVFIEVRYRKNATFGGAEASITPAKQRKIRLSAACFLQQFPRFQNYPCRFDVLAFSREQECGNWIKNAFE